MGCLPAASLACDGGAAAARPWPFRLPRHRSLTRPNPKPNPKHTGGEAPDGDDAHRAGRALGGRRRRQAQGGEWIHRMGPMGLCVWLAGPLFLTPRALLAWIIRRPPAAAAVAGGQGTRRTGQRATVVGRASRCRRANAPRAGRAGAGRRRSSSRSSRRRGACGTRGWTTPRRCPPRTGSSRAVRGAACIGVGVGLGLGWKGLSRT